MFSSLIRVGLLVGSMLASQSSGQGPIKDLQARDDTSRMPVPNHPMNDDRSLGAAGPDGLSGNSSRQIADGAIDFIMTRIDEAVVKEFRAAWKVAGSGFMQREGVVLLYRGVNSSLLARSQGCTNELRQFSFAWKPNIIAVVHTHPNDHAPEPSTGDVHLADRFGVPVFTITCRGMFVYDPATKKISRVRKNLDWLMPTSSLLASYSK